MSMAGITNRDGARIVANLIKGIQEQKQYLSDIDGLIGDGDHGINMNKGFTLCEEQLQEDPGDLAHGLGVLSGILMAKIGGSMGPLYGMYFRAMGKACDGEEHIDRDTFGRMLKAGLDAVRSISTAQPGDKTLLDVLVPAEEQYRSACEAGQSFSDCLNAMTAAARKGRDDTKDLVAKAGRSSRLGERSRGVIDAGAASSCLILETMADTIQGSAGQGD